MTAIRNNGGITADRSPREIQADLQQIRSRMEETLASLEQRLSPSVLVEQLWGRVRNRWSSDERGGGFSAVTGTIRDNPVPVGLIGAGLLYLALSQRREAGHSAEPALEWDEVRGETPDENDGSVSEKARAIGGRVKHAGTAGARSVAGAAGRAGEAVRGAGQRVVAGGRAAKQEASRMLHEQPLVLAGLGLALGAAIGATTPISRREQELFGPKRDELVARGMAHGRQALDEVERRGQAALHAGRDEAQRQGLEARKISQQVRASLQRHSDENEERLRRVVQVARDAAAEKSRQPHAQPTWPETRRPQQDPQSSPGADPLPPPKKPEPY